MKRAPTDTQGPLRHTRTAMGIGGSVATRNQWHERLKRESSLEPTVFSGPLAPPRGNKSLRQAVMQLLKSRIWGPGNRTYYAEASSLFKGMSQCWVLSFTNPSNSLGVERFFVRSPPSCFPPGYAITFLFSILHMTPFKRGIGTQLGFPARPNQP